MLYFQTSLAHDGHAMGILATGQCLPSCVNQAMSKELSHPALIRSVLRRTSSSRSLFSFWYVGNCTFNSQYVCILPSLMAMVQWNLPQKPHGLGGPWPTTACPAT